MNGCVVAAVVTLEPDSSKYCRSGNEPSSERAILGSGLGSGSYTRIEWNMCVSLSCNSRLVCTMVLSLGYLTERNGEPNLVPSSGNVPSTTGQLLWSPISGVKINARALLLDKYELFDPTRTRERERDR